MNITCEELSLKRCAGCLIFNQPYSPNPYNPLIEISCKDYKKSPIELAKEDSSKLIKELENHKLQGGIAFTLIKKEKVKDDNLDREISA